MNTSTVLQKGNEWYSVSRTVPALPYPYHVTDMFQRPIRTKKVVNVKPVSKKTIKAGTKFEAAIGLYKKGTTRDDFVALLISKLNMTPAGANTYYYKCRKEVSG